jgi:hypothetical protein
MGLGLGVGAVGWPECHQIQPATSNPAKTNSQTKRLSHPFRERGRRYLVWLRTARFSHKWGGLPKH